MTRDILQFVFKTLTECLFCFFKLQEFIFSIFYARKTIFFKKNFTLCLSEILRYLLSSLRQVCTCKS